MNAEKTPNAVFLLTSREPDAADVPGNLAREVRMARYQRWWNANLPEDAKLDPEHEEADALRMSEEFFAGAEDAGMEAPAEFAFHTLIAGGRMVSQAPKSSSEQELEAWRGEQVLFYKRVLEWVHAKALIYRFDDRDEFVFVDDEWLNRHFPDWRSFRNEA